MEPFSQCVRQRLSFPSLGSPTDEPLPQLMQSNVFQCLHCFSTQKTAISFFPIFSELSVLLKRLLNITSFLSLLMQYMSKYKKRCNSQKRSLGRTDHSGGFPHLPSILNTYNNGKIFHCHTYIYTWVHIVPLHKHSQFQLNGSELAQRVYVSPFLHGAIGLGC